MAFERAITALATLEEKLRRALGLAGQIGATFEPILRPVIIAGDLREPGSSGGNSGRAYAWSHFENAAQVRYSVQFQADLFVDGFFCAPVATSPVVMWLGFPGQTPDVPCVTQAGVWVDRRGPATVVDSVPILEANVWAVGGAGPAESSANRVLTIANAQYIPLRMMVLAGTTFNWRTGAAGNIGIGFHGRVWP